jgi:Oligoendopeptidase F
MDSSAVYTLFEELKQKIEELDKNATPDDQTDSTVNSEELISLIEELKVKLNQPQFSKRQIENLGQIAANSINMINANFSKAFSELKSAITPIDEKINQIKSQQNVVIRKEHVFSIDFRNSKAALTMITMGIIILLSFGGNIWQWNRNSELKNNDLKYRYIKILGKATSKDLLRLETIFNYDQNKDSIYVIGEQIKTYERLVKEQVEKIERVRLSNSKLKQ